MQESDAFVVWNTTECVLSELADMNLINNYIVNDQVNVGAQGDCSGSELHFKFGLFMPCPCETS